MRKRIVSIAAVILILSIVVCGCADNGKDGPLSSEITSAADPGLNLLAEGEIAYKIVRADNSLSAVTACASALKKSFREICGFEIGIGTDWLNKDEQPGEYEILVGDTNRPESAEAASREEDGKYIICVIGRKVVINAPTVNLLNQAVIDFAEMFLSKERAVVPEDTFILGSVTSPIKSVTANWVLKDLGYWSSGIFNTTYDGNFGCVFPSGTGGTFLKNNFEKLSFAPKGTTVAELISQNNIKPGDIIFFKDHIQIIIDSERAFDAGRSNCEVHEVGAKFCRWVGPNLFFTSKQVGYILRANDAE